MNQIADGMGRNGTGDYEYKTKCVIQLLLLHSALLGRRRSTLQQQRIHFQKPIDKMMQLCWKFVAFSPDDRMLAMDVQLTLCCLLHLSVCLSVCVIVIIIVWQLVMVGAVELVSCCFYC